MHWRFPLFRHRKLERELDAELRFHLDQQIAANLARGMSPEEARRCAALEFGGLDQMKEACRDQRGLVWFDHRWQDLRYAGRQLLHARTFSATSLLTVAIGIGACTAIFSLVNAVLLKPLRLTDPDRIVTIEETRPPDREQVAPAPGAYFDWVNQTSVFEQLAAHRGLSFNTKVNGNAQNISAESITANYFSVLGVRPFRGRVFLPEEQASGGHRVVILSHWFWVEQLGARDNVINESISLDDQPFTIVGILPDKNLIWNPAVFVPAFFSPTERSDYGSHGLGCIGRLKPGRSIEQAQAEMNLVSDRIARAHPDSNSGHGASIAPLLQDLTGNVRAQLLLLLGAVGIVLLIACVNVASLQFARAHSRQKEISMRSALGASRGRIVSQLLCESFLLVGSGGAVGALIAFGTTRAAARFASQYVPRTDEISVDGTVLLVTFALVVVATVLVGLLPALQVTRGDLVESIKASDRTTSGGRRPQRVRSFLVVVEIALALILLAGTGLLARSLLALQRSDQGFKSDNVYISQLSFGGKKYDSPIKARSFVDLAIERITALPTVRRVAFSNGLPMINVEGLLFKVIGTPEVPTRDLPHTRAFAVTPDYFNAMDIPLLVGRGFTAKDSDGAPRVIIINRELARQHFAGVNAIGKRLMVLTMADQPDAIREIVGVVGDVKIDGPQSSFTSQVYEPFAQRTEPNANLILRVEGANPAIIATVSHLIQGLDPDLPLQNFQHYSDALANAWFRQEFSIRVFVLFSGVALLLAAIGIYGVMAYSVDLRTREIGIRMALGASARDVLFMVGGGGGRIIALGLILGLVGAVAFARILQSLLFETSPYDPLTLLGVSLVLAVVGLIACWGPARRATKVNPVVALRTE